VRPLRLHCRAGNVKGGRPPIIVSFAQEMTTKGDAAEYWGGTCANGRGYLSEFREGKKSMKTNREWIKYLELDPLGHKRLKYMDVNSQEGSETTSRLI